MADLTEHELDWFLDPIGCPPLLGEDNPVQRIALELRRHRAMVKRLEEWALSLEHDMKPERRAFGAELRNRMKGE